MNFPQNGAGLPEQSIARLNDDLAWLPAVDPGHVKILNTFRQSKADLHFRACGLSGNISIADRPCPLVKPIALPFLIGPWRGLLFLPDRVIDHLLRPLGVAQSTFDLTPLQRGILLEHRLTELLNELEAAIAHQVCLDGSQEAAEFDVVLPWVIELSDFKFHAELHMGMECAHELGRIIAKFQRTDVGTLAQFIVFPMQLCAGTQSLTVFELKSLKPGDVILRAETSGTDPLAILSGRLIAPTRRDGASHVLDGVWKPFNKTQELLMKSKTESDIAVALGDADQFEDLPVQLVFEIGRCELPLSEVRKLGEGSIVPTAPSASNAVNILANGRLVGNGELVKIGAGLGVRILRLSKNG